MNPDKNTHPDTIDECEDDFPGQERVHSIIHSMAISSKWLFTLAVIGTGLIAAMLFVYGFAVSIAEIIRAIAHFSLDIHVAKDFMETAIQIVDIFLVATVFYLISLGLYELFIAKAPLPGWAQIRDLDDLKEKLLGLTVIAVSVVFLGTALNLPSETSFLEIGISVGVLIGSISLYIWAKK